MKILFMAISYHPEQSKRKTGGGMISMRKLLEELSIDNEITVLCAFGSEANKQKINNITYYDLSENLKFLPRKLRENISKILFQYWSFRTAKSIESDIVICGTYSVSSALKYGIFVDKPVGIFIRALENINSEKTYKNFIKKIIYGEYKLEKLRKLKFIISNSIFIKNTCLKITKIENHVIYPSVDHYASQRETTKIKNILMISTSNSKGFGIFKEIAKLMPELNFKAIGGVTSNTTSCNPKNLLIKDWTPNISQEFDKADLVLVPSIIDEAFGRVSIEALLHGCHVLVSSRGGLPETVDFNENLIVADETPSAWIKKINDLIIHITEYEIYREELKERAKIFSTKEQAKKLESIFIKQIK